jgi:quinol monooxygenase YgiN
VAGKIIGTLRMAVHSEKNRRELLDSIRGMLEPARVERGCLNYNLYEDVENRNAFVLLEEWASAADLESHVLKNDERRLLALMDILNTHPELKFNTVSDISGMDFIEGALSRSGK